MPDDLPPPLEVLERAANAAYAEAIAVLDAADRLPAASPARTALLLDVERLIMANGRIGDLIVTLLNNESEARAAAAAVQWLDGPVQLPRCSSLWGEGGAVQCEGWAGHVDRGQGDHIGRTRDGGTVLWHDGAAWSHDVGGGRWSTAEDATQAELQRIANDPPPVCTCGYASDPTPIAHLRSCPAWRSETRDR